MSHRGKPRTCPGCGKRRRLLRSGVCVRCEKGLTSVS